MVADEYLLIIFFLLPLLLLPLPLPQLLALGEHLQRRPLLLLHLLLPPQLILLHGPAVVLVHLPLLFHAPPLFVLAPPPALLAELEVLIPKVLLEMTLVAALLVDFFLQVVLGAHNFLEFSTLTEKHLLTGFKFMQQRSVVVIPTSREMILHYFFIEQFLLCVVLLDLALWPSGVDLAAPIVYPI